MHRPELQSELELHDPPEPVPAPSGLHPASVGRAQSNAHVRKSAFLIPESLPPHTSVPSLHIPRNPGAAAPIPGDVPARGRARTSTMASGLVAGGEDHKRGFRRIVVLLIWLVIVPSASLLALGILMLIFWRVPELNLVFGILVLALVGCLATGTVLSLVFLRREAKLSKLQTDFVSKVSHELRTPLTSIRMFAEMLQTTDDPEQVRLCHDVLQRETARLSERIERLLDWGRMEAGRRVYHRRPTDVQTIVDKALAAFDTATIGRSQEVGVTLAPDLPQLLADDEALVDALVNLLSNAYKYTGDDKEITLGASADARHLRLWVSDNGPGIPRREQRRIFQKFYRMDDRLARDVEGSGLGLAIVRHVAHAHGGRIDVDSEDGGGSTFTIVLPTPREAALAAARDTVEAAPAE